MRIRLRIRPEQAPGILAGLVQVSLAQIKLAGAAGTYPVKEALQRGAQIRAQGILPKTPEWTAAVAELRAQGLPVIYYERLDPEEEWKTWEQLLLDGYGDCEDLVIAVVAELLAGGHKAIPLAYRPAPGLWHVIYRYADPVFGWVNRDPSKLGGMAGAA